MARFRALIIPGLVVLAALAVLVSLGNWQVRRLAWKTDLIANATARPTEQVRDLPSAGDWPKIDVAAGEYRPFRLTGRFRHDREAFVFTSLSDAKGSLSGPGYWIVTPFELAGGGTVMVNRGFAPQGRQTPEERGEALSGSPTAVVGLLRPGESPNLFTPGDRPDANVFFARNPARIAAAKGVSGPVAPFTIDLLAAETPPGGLPQAGETRMVFTNNHLGYAVTWYGLAAALLAVFASFVATRSRDVPQDVRLTGRGEAP